MSDSLITASYLREHQTNLAISTSSTNSNKKVVSPVSQWGVDTYYHCSYCNRDC